MSELAAGVKKQSTKCQCDEGLLRKRDLAEKVEEKLHACANTRQAGRI